MGELTLSDVLPAALEEVRDDPVLREILRAAKAWRVQPSKLLGRRVADLVVDVDEAGRPVRWHSLPWPVQDVALALALESYDRDTCKGCGHQLTESTRPENEFRYRSELPIRCHACTALGQSAEPYQESHQPQALRFAVSLREPERARTT
jgi:hypothetical protein